MNSNKIKGNQGEEMAADYLTRQGYILIERNWRYHHLEVDIIAHLNGILHIVEVKTRHSLQFGQPEESISRSKMSFLRNAAQAYQGMHPEWKWIQFDVIAITVFKDKGPEILMIEDVYF